MPSTARLLLLWRIIIIIIITTKTTAFFLLLLLLPCRTQAWYIAPPASNTDWEQLAQLLANENEPNDNAAALEKMQWSLWGRQQTQDTLYRRYVRNARQLRDAKYAVLVAKQWGDVLGVAEMGKQADRRAVVGVLSVAPAARRQGVGAALVKHCEATAANVWNETTLWVEVETTNQSARRFFESCGYKVVVGQEEEEPTMVAVQTRNGLEKRPHVVLAKSLPLCEEKEDNSVKQPQ